MPYASKAQGIKGIIYISNIEWLKPLLKDSTTINITLSTIYLILFSDSKF